MFERMGAAWLTEAGAAGDVARADARALPGCDQLAGMRSRPRPPAAPDSASGGRDIVVPASRPWPRDLNYGAGRSSARSAAVEVEFRYVIPYGSEFVSDVRVVSQISRRDGNLPSSVEVYHA